MREWSGRMLGEVSGFELDEGGERFIGRTGWHMAIVEVLGLHVAELVGFFGWSLW